MYCSLTSLFSLELCDTDMATALREHAGEHGITPGPFPSLYFKNNTPPPPKKPATTDLPPGRPAGARPCTGSPLPPPNGASSPRPGLEPAAPPLTDPSAARARTRRTLYGRGAVLGGAPPQGGSGPRPGGYWLETFSLIFLSE